MKDLFGQALLDYQQGIMTGSMTNIEDLVTATSISEEDVLPLEYLFRSFKQMPKIEQKALELSRGNILDVGCGAGNHSLFLQEKGLKVTGIDISIGAIEVCKLRELKHAYLRNLLDETNTYDTILLLMNGSGIFQEISQVSKYLTHLKSILNTDGQILIDSSDIKYMFEDEDGGFWFDANSNYYGELDYFVSYKGENDTPFKCLYLDFNTLFTACSSVGLNCEMVLEGEHYDYLARITA